MATKTGGEILVNTTTTGSQGYQSVTALSNGGFVVVWQDESVTGADQSTQAIRAQLFDAAGGKVGAEFLVNTTTANGQTAPSVEEVSGGFVVAWEDASLALGDTALRGVVSQRFDLNGAKVGGETLVNTTTTGTQSSPDIALVQDSNYVVAWTDDSATGGDTSGSAVRGQMFTQAGVKVGSEFLLNTTTSNAQASVDVAGKGPNGFVAVWADLSRTGGDTDGYAVRGQRFGVGGDKIGDEFLVNTTTAGSQLAPSVYSFSDASFIVAFRDQASGVEAIKVQKFTNLGVKSGGELTIAGPDSGFKGGVDIATLSNGGFVVAWQDTRTAGGDTDGSSIWMQEYSAAGAKVGAEQLVNTSTVGAQGNPDIEVLANGAVVVSWEDFGAVSGDLSGRAVKAQLFSTEAGGGTSTTPSTGPDNLTGTAGPDTFAAQGGNDTVSGGQGADNLDGGDGDDRINGGEGVAGAADGGDNVSGGAGNDTINGNVGADTVSGDAGNDVVRGGRDDDIVFGGDGDDYVSGDLGSDTITGGAGADIFHTFGAAGIDRVTDFNRGEGDRVQLDPGTTYNAFQQGADTVVQMGGGGEIRLVGVTMSTLSDGWLFIG